jgi:hypothetical protein
MDSKVRHCLSRCGAIVDANVESVRPIRGVRCGPRIIEEGEKYSRSTFVASKNEPTYRLGITRVCSGEIGRPSYI